MDLLGKLRRFFLLAGIECALVHAVHDHGISQLAPCQLVQHQTLFTGVDHFAVVQRGVLLLQLRLPGKLFQDGEQFVVYGLRRVVVGKSASHRHRVLRNTLRTAFARHRFRQVYAAFFCFQLFKSRQRIEIVPMQHGFVSSMKSFLIARFSSVGTSLPFPGRFFNPAETKIAVLFTKEHRVTAKIRELSDKEPVGFLPRVWYGIRITGPIDLSGALYGPDE